MAKAFNNRHRGYQRNDALADDTDMLMFFLREYHRENHAHLTVELRDQVMALHGKLRAARREAIEQRDGPNSARPDLVRERREGA